MLRSSRPRTTSLAAALLAGGAALALTACGGSGTSEVQGSKAEITLSVTTPIGGPDNYHNIPIDDFFTAVEEASDGRISYEFNYANSVVPPAEVGTAIADGTVDAGLVVTSYNPAEYPVSNWLSNLGFAGESGPPAAALERAAAATSWWKTHPEAAQADFVDQGIIPLTPGFNAHTAYHLICTEPVTSLADAKGKSVRSPGEAWASTATALGMEPVSLPGAEMYESLQRGIVDCVMADATDMVDSNLTEVAKHYTTVNLPGFTPYGLFISKQIWDSLDAELKTAVWEQLDVYFSSLARQGVELQQELLDSPGMEFHEMEDDLAKAVSDHQASVREDAPSSAPEVISDPQAAVDDFFALHEDWSAVVKNDLGVDSATSWAKWSEAGGQPADIDFDAYSQRLWIDTFEANLPE